MTVLKVQIERGSKRTFATAVDWPGWSRSAKDDDAAIELLLDYERRYKRAIGAAAKSLKVTKVDVIESVKGDSSTDFGVPHAPLPDDDAALTGAEMKRWIVILKASWRAFDKAVDKATGATLSTGPRGGGRTLAKMRAHLVDADQAYVHQLGAEPPASTDLDVLRAAFLDALAARARGEIDDVGPRGGRRWTPRYAIHRSAWHALDHAWEIEGRS